MKNQSSLFQNILNMKICVSNNGALPPCIFRDGHYYLDKNTNVL